MVAMMFGGETKEAGSKRIISITYDQDINFIDTADVYHAGRLEELLGRALVGQRDTWVVATKFDFPTTQGPNEQGQSRKWITTNSLSIVSLHRVTLRHQAIPTPDTRLKDDVPPKAPVAPDSTAVQAYRIFPARTCG